MSSLNHMNDHQALRECHRAIYRAVQYMWKYPNSVNEVDDYILRCNQVLHRFAVERGIAEFHTYPLIPWPETKDVVQSLSSAIATEDIRVLEIVYRALFQPLKQRKIIIKLLLPDELKVRAVNRLATNDDPFASELLRDLVLPIPEQIGLLEDAKHVVQRLAHCLASVRKVDESTWTSNKVDLVGDVISAAQDIEMWARPLRNLNTELGLAVDDHVINLDMFKAEDFSGEIDRAKILEGLTTLYTKLSCCYPQSLSESILDHFSLSEGIGRESNAWKEELIKHAHSAGNPPSELGPLPDPFSRLSLRLALEEREQPFNREVISSAGSNYGCEPDEDALVLPSIFSDDSSDEDSDIFEMEDLN